MLTEFIAKKESVFGVILVRIFPAFSRIRTESGLEKHGIRTFFTQCNIRDSEIKKLREYKC